MSTRVLAMDVGNTKMMVGLFDNASLVRHWKLRTVRNRTADEYVLRLQELLRQEALSFSDVQATVVASVVPHATKQLKSSFFRSASGQAPMIVDVDSPRGFALDIDAPERLGPDLIAVTQGALMHNDPPFIVVDAGTATTITAVDGDRKFLGGAIAPGIGIGADALSRAAAALPEIELAIPESVIGKNTKDAMESGLIFGHVEMVRGMVERIRKILGQAEVPVLVTGGAGKILHTAWEETHAFYPDLVLEGLLAMHKRALEEK